MIDLSADNATFFADFRESVIYRPKGGVPRTIQAIIHRQQVTEASESPTGGRRPPTLIVEARNSPTAGIESARVNTGGDEIKVAYAIGDVPRWREILRVLSQDEGHVKVEVRA